ncbi:MAG: fused DSP-PTPase phosphatase/NAD kinase-like protein [Armatimonadota bacterium]
MRGIWIGVCIAGWAAAFAVAAPPAPTGAVQARVTEKEIPNFAAVAPGIWRGAAPTKDGLRRLKSMGVRHIVDLRIERKGQDAEAAACRELGLERTRIRMGREAPTAKQVAQFLALCDGAGTAPVFIHCQHGADRTGAMVGIYRVARQGWEYPRARAEMRKYGFTPWLHELEDSVRSRAGGARPTGRR